MSKEENVNYAQINDEGICFAVSSLSGTVDQPNMIQLDSYDMSVLGKRYADGNWQEVEQPTVEPEPTQLDRIEEAVQQNYAEAQQEGADAITLEMIERGVI